MTATKGGTVKKEEQVPTEKSIKVKKPERKEVEKTKKVRNPETRPLEMAPTEQSALSEDATKPPGCKHNFGYLGSRKKGEVIPDACLECPKSLDCVLFDYYKSKESVAEIKKWYPALHPPA